MASRNVSYQVHLRSLGNDLGERPSIHHLKPTLMQIDCWEATLQSLSAQAKETASSLGSRGALYRLLLCR